MDRDIEALRGQMCLWIKSHDKHHELENATRDAERRADRELNSVKVGEIDRRLDLLNNHAAEMAAQQQANVEALSNQQQTYVMKITFDNAITNLSHRVDDAAKCSELAALNLRVDANKRELDRFRLIEANVRGQVIAYSAMFGILSAVISFVAGKLL